MVNRHYHLNFSIIQIYEMIIIEKSGCVCVWWQDAKLPPHTNFYSLISTKRERLPLFVLILSERGTGTIMTTGRVSDI